jgi:hypothetical protein
LVWVFLAGGPFSMDDVLFKMESVIDVCLCLGVVMFVQATRRSNNVAATTPTTTACNIEL